MTIQDKNTATGELSYFETTLLLYLKESHPHMSGDREFIRSRADEAADAYECSIRNGLSVTQALEQSDAVLYRNLHFSGFDTVFEVVSEWFPEVPPEKRADFCLKMLSPAEVVFNKYPIDDRFEDTFQSSKTGVAVQYPAPFFRETKLRAHEHKFKCGYIVR